MRLTHWLKEFRNRFSSSPQRKVRSRRNKMSPAAQISSQALESRMLLTTTYINAGGPGLNGDPSFVADDAFENGAGRDLSRRSAIDLSQVDVNLPESVFKTNLVDRARSGEIQFDIPVTSGNDYQVDLLFSELQSARARDARRIFDVGIEGEVVLNDFDVFADSGFRTAVAKSFNITATDNNLDIDLTSVVGRAAIAGIVVHDLSDDGNDGGDGGGQTNTAPQLSSVADQNVTQDQSLGPIGFTATDADGDAVTVTATSNNASVVTNAGISVAGSGDNRTVAVTPVAGATGSAVVTLLASDGQLSDTEAFTVTVNADNGSGPVDPPPSDVIAVNAGGSAVGDFQSAAGLVGTSRSFGRGSSVGNVPQGIPQAVFQTSLFTRRRDGDLHIDIPTSVGVEYRVDLLFNEAQQRRSGRRVFDVSLDGQQVINDLDIFARVGRNTALVETFTVTGDGNLDIDLARVRSNPFISGVIVTPLNGDGGGGGGTGNRAPVIAPISTRTVSRNGTVQFDVTATDADNDNLTYSINTTGLPGTPSINAQLGSFSWTPPTAGTFSMTVIATDGQLSDSETFSIIVTDTPPANQAPVLANIGSQQIVAGSPITFTAAATDPNAGDTVTYSLAPNAPAGTSINSSTGNFTWTPTVAQVGSNFVTVRASDGELSDSETVSINVTAPAAPNEAPSLAAIADQTVQAGTQLQVTASATDPNAGDTLTYSLVTTGLPGTPQIDSATGVFTWTPPFPDGPGFQIRLRVTDGGGLTDDVTFSVLVTDAPDGNSAPVIDPISAQSGNVGTPLTFTVTATDANIPPDTLSFFLDPNAPNGADINGATGVFTWTPTAEGTFTFPVLVGDGTVNVSQSVTITVGAAVSNQSPEFGPIGNRTTRVNEQLQFTLPASDGDDDSLTYSLVTTGLPGSPVVNAVTGEFTWTPTQISPGFNVTVRVEDGRGGSDNATFTVTVNDESPTGNTTPTVNPVATQQATVGQLFTVTVTATDPDPGTTLTFFLDPTAPSGITIGDQSGVLTWTPAAGDVGTVTFPVFVGDGVANVSTNVTVVVSNSGGGTGPNSSPQFGPQNNRTVAAGSTLNATITATDDDPGDVLTYALLSSDLPGNPTVNAQTGQFVWTPPASAAGQSFQVMIRATDAQGASDDAVFNVNVNAGGSGNQAPVLTAVPQQQATVGQQLSFTVVATDADGDTLDFFLDPTAPFSADLNSGSGVFTWTPAAGDVGTVTFPIFVSDGTANRSIDVTVVVSASTGGGGGNTSPSMAPIDNQTVDEGVALTVTPVVDDPDQGEVLTFTLLTTDLPGSPTVNAQTGVFSWTPPADAGPQNYSVSIQVRDSGGLTSIGTFNVQVNNTL